MSAPGNDCVCFVESSLYKIPLKKLGNLIVLYKDITTVNTLVFLLSILYKVSLFTFDKFWPNFLNLSGSFQ